MASVFLALLARAPSCLRVAVSLSLCLRVLAVAVPLILRLADYHPNEAALRHGAEAEVRPRRKEEPVREDGVRLRKVAVHQLHNLPRARTCGGVGVGVVLQGAV